MGGRATKDNNLPDAVLEIEVYVNGNLYEVAKISTDNRVRRNELTWNYDLKEGENNITLKAKEIPGGYRIETQDVLVYTRNKPGKLTYY